MRDEATFRVKSGLAEMLKGGVIMDVVDADVAALEQPARPAIGLQRHYLSLKALIRSA